MFRLQSAATSRSAEDLAGKSLAPAAAMTHAERSQGLCAMQVVVHVADEHLRGIPFNRYSSVLDNLLGELFHESDYESQLK